MQATQRFLTAAILITCLVTGGHVAADSIRLTNGDTIVGKVVSLDENQLVLESENFGEMKIPRQKVEIIGLGDSPLVQAIANGAPAAPAASGELPSMQNPQVRQQIDRLLRQSLGGELGDIGQMRQQMESTRRGLKDLQQDLGPGASADALEGYIKMFEMFGAGAAPETPSPQNEEN